MTGLSGSKAGDACAAPINFNSINLPTISLPPDRVRKNVITQGVQFLLIADNPFVVVPLPYRQAGRVPRFIDPFRAGGFETGNERSEGFRRTM